MVENLSATGNPVDPTVTYCDVSDVTKYTRGQKSNLTDEQIESIIEEKTRFVEKETTTAFRQMELTDYVRSVNLSSEQKREEPSSRFSTRQTENRIGISSGSSDRWVDVVLPNDRIQSVQSLTVVTSALNDITNDKGDAWRFSNARDGVIQIDHLAFKQTLSGKSNENKFEDAKIRISYTYGRGEIEPDIRNAVAKLTTYEILNTDAFGTARSEDESGFVAVDEMTERMRNEAMDVVNSYK